MPEEEYSSDAFFDGPAYALVIGVSEYQQWEDPKRKFPDLNYAHLDAEAFAQYLRSHGFNENNVYLLTNNKADREAIIEHLEKLRRNCAETTNPLVIVFFSGHGWSGSDNRHYLVPYDGKRDKLEGSGLHNDYLSDQLRRLKTDKLVVFIDACHAGAVDMIKGDRPPYEMTNMLGEGDGRYLISSCRPQQKSYEWEEKKHGIFTEHLLELLKCEGDAIPFEEIRVGTLFDALVPRVKKTAHDIHKQDQEPTSEGGGSSSIVLAINSKIRNEKKRKADEARADKLEFRDEVCKQINISPNCPDKSTLKLNIQAYAESGEKDKDYDDFYQVFDDHFSNWRDGRNAKYVSECVKYLSRAHRLVVESRKAQSETQKSARISPVLAAVQTGREQQKAAMQSDPVTTTELAKPTEGSAATDNFQKPEKTAESPPPAGEPLAPASPPAGQSGGSRVTKKLSPEDCEFVLEELTAMIPEYYSILCILGDLLAEPLTAGAFTQRTYQIRRSNRTDPKLVNMLDEIVKRFTDRWANAAEVEAPAGPTQATTVTGVMLGRI